MIRWHCDDTHEGTFSKVQDLPGEHTQASKAELSLRVWASSHDGILCPWLRPFAMRTKTSPLSDIAGDMAVHQ